MSNLFLILKWVLRLTGAVAAVATLLVVVGALWFSVSLFGSLPKTEGQIMADGLSAPVTITRDDRGIPWIDAQSEADAYFALGFVHAQDRLFQMEMMRRTGQGRLSELVGPMGLRTDRFMRTLGLYRLAEQSAATLDPATKVAVDAYTSGINAFLESSGPLPLEFQIMWFSPEPWQAADSIVWQKLMGLQLSGNWNEELLRVQLIESLGSEKASRLFPDTETRGPVTIAAAARVEPERAKTLLAEVMDIAKPTLASNIWALSPNRTATRGAILANDPHLNFSSPNLWYIATVSYPGVTLTGATVPGVPFHLLGQNGNMAWGFTTTHGDTQDLFVEQVVGGTSYMSPIGPLPFETHEETINVRFGAPETIAVLATRHGPVVSDLVDTSARKAAGGTDTVLALAATLLIPDDRSADAIYAMARAKNAQDFRAAAARFHSPQQNVMFADSRGNIGYVAAGRLPIRASESCNGIVPTSGVDGTCDWLGWVPFEELPQALNPKTGVLINANNRIVGPEYSHLIATEWPEPYRAQRIEDTIADRAGITLAQIANLQFDDVSLMARELVPLLIDNLDTKDERGLALAEILRIWDGSTGRERVEPLIFTVWIERLKAKLIADELGPLYGDFFGDRPALIHEILSKDSVWCDDTTTSQTESCRSAVTAAWTETLQWIETRLGPDPTAWRWGDVHIARFRHPIFGFVPGLRSFGSFEIATGGDNATVNRGSSARTTSDPPLSHRHGPGIRAIYDLADPAKSQFTLAGGQSAHPLSPHFDDLLVGWRDGDYFRVTKPDENASNRLELAPVGP
ncbi:MAG: penicillin acylase family protein [Rhodobacteraceae bacterium]|nr:penicillin acylase family protein [Paracoccaceae bacterium]